MVNGKKLNNRLSNFLKKFKNSLVKLDQSAQLQLDCEMPKLLTGAEIVFKCLEDQNVEYIFGYPGGAVYLYMMN